MNTALTPSFSLRKFFKYKEKRTTNQPLCAIDVNVGKINTWNIWIYPPGKLCAMLYYFTCSSLLLDPIFRRSAMSFKPNNFLLVK